MSLQRRYAALRARAEDQKGTPEGDLCADFVRRLDDQYPELSQGSEGPELSTELCEFRWKDWYEQQLLIRIGDYFAAVPLRYTDRPRLQVLLFDVDQPTCDLMRHAHAVLLPRMVDVLKYSAVGFMVGALPVPRDDDRSADTDEEPPDPMLCELGDKARLLGLRQNLLRALRAPDDEQKDEP